MIIDNYHNLMIIITIFFIQITAMRPLRQTLQQLLYLLIANYIIYIYDLLLYIYNCFIWRRYDEAWSDEDDANSDRLAEWIPADK